MNKLKVAKSMLILEKVARSCSFYKKLLKIQKVAKKLPSTICLCLTMEITPLTSRVGEDLNDITQKPKMHWFFLL